MRIKILSAASVAGACALLAGCNAPKAVDDTVVAGPDTATVVDVLANDINPQGNPLLVKRAWGAQKGVVTINPDNTVTYVPRVGELGPDSFQYRMKDNRGHASNAIVSVDIEPRNPSALVTPPDTIVKKETVVVTPAPLPPLPPPGPPPAAIERERVMGTTETPVAPAVSKGPFIETVFVTLHTTGDDKNREEPVRIVVKRGNEILADRTVGGGELWGSFTDNSFEVPLHPQPPLSDAGRLTLDIRKTGVGSPNGGGWTMQTEARARMSDGSTAVILPTTDPVKMGDDAPAERSWTLSPPK